jgi:7-cyano-7-deazaguanine tRNA-ribosyltransferase
LLKFEIKNRDALGRICKFSTLHGTITTPTLMPVVNPNKMIITPKEMKKLFGMEIVITNSYIIKKDEKLREDALKDGIHKLINFNGPIMTDSGTFQSYRYGDVTIDPMEIVEFQRDIGSDIGTILDVFVAPDLSKTKAEKGVKETLKRAKESVKIKGNMLLACTVQGSIFPELREKCGRSLSKIDADFFPIGGVVPLMENQRYSDLIKVILSSKKGLYPSNPVHLFGAGHPMIFPLAVALGCDFFDSSAYAKYANDQRMIFYWGTEKLEHLTELPCNCPVCSKYIASDIKELDKKSRILEIAKHNLYVSFAEIKKIRAAISEGNLWELVERRANSNPYLLGALNILRTKDNKDFLELFEPISKKKALFYTGCNTIHRPILHRCHKRLINRYLSSFNTTIVFPDGDKPYSWYLSEQIKKIRAKNPHVNLLVDSHLGPVPLELDEMYPFAQSVFPEIVDKETEEEVSKIFHKFTRNKAIICWKDIRTLENLKPSIEKSQNFDLLRVSAVSDMQFGKDVGKIILKGSVSIIKSKKTGKIRNIYRDGKHILSMRASDGMFTLKIEGAKLLHNSFKFPKWRVVVDKDIAPFIKDGKSVYAKFVKECDPDLRPFDECLIVDEDDNLLAVGKCLLNRSEMLNFNFGVAVKTREKNA